MSLRTRKLAAGLVAAAGSVILLTTVLFKDEIYERLYGIRRVRTWGDLLSQRPIRLSDGVIVRVGIEDTRCQEGSGVLLYCLAEGYDPGSANGVDEDSLGPIEVWVVEENPNVNQESSVRLEDLSPISSRKGDPPAKLLFARAIVVPRRGKYHVTVLERGTALRFVTVEGTGEPAHPWLNLEKSAKWELGRFIPGGGAAALPARAGSFPLPDPCTREGLLDPARPLPRLTPDAGAPAEIVLSLDGNSVVATSRDKLSPHSEHFLTRWWINGEPHFPASDSFMVGREGGLRRIDVDTFRFELDFDSPGFECRTGDRIGLQLLYCGRGWSFIKGESPLFAPENQNVYASNRIELTVP